MATPMPPLTLCYEGLLIWAVAGAPTARFYQLSGSEIIEIDSRKRVISKDVLGWPRTREYSIQDCREI
jgi:hypothetical protein